MNTTFQSQWLNSIATCSPARKHMSTRPGDYLTRSLKRHIHSPDVFDRTARCCHSSDGVGGLVQCHVKSRVHSLLHLQRGAQSRRGATLLCRPSHLRLRLHLSTARSGFLLRPLEAFLLGLERGAACGRAETATVVFELLVVLVGEANKHSVNACRGVFNAVACYGGRTL